MKMRVLKPGLQTSIQDGGRPGMMRWGIACGGAADSYAMTLANVLLHNPPQHPCLEVTITGPVLEFTAAVSIAVTGARFELQLNGASVANDEVIQVPAGGLLQFGPLRSGARAYIAIAAEMALPATLHSFATHLVAGFGGLQGIALQAGDEIRLRNCHQVPNRRLPPQFCFDHGGRPLIRVVTGSEADDFPATAKAAFYDGEFTVTSQSNRMGIRLDGEPLEIGQPPQVISSGLCPGTIQVPPNGLPIISFVEGQTIGGYPRIAHVISADLHRLGQLRPGNRVSFDAIDLDTAWRILRDKQRALSALAVWNN